MNTLKLIASSLLCAAATAVAAQDLAKIRAFAPISERIASAGQPSEAQIAEIGRSGYAVLVNLSPPFVKLNDREGLLATAAGMSYVQIPVDLKSPQLRDLEFFFAVMNANRDRKVFVHCETNLRTSAFLYLYQVVHGGVEEAWARSTLHQVWEPHGAWPEFIASALKHYGKP